MLLRPAVIDELQTILIEWVAAISSPNILGAYLFGSTVNDGGVRFQPDSGDLDVIIVVDWESLPPGERVTQINTLRDAKLELEALLLRKLGREKASEQIVSLIPVTPFEVEQAVHKDGVTHIFTHARAYDLWKKHETECLAGGQSASPLTEAHRSVLQFVQKKRAEALSVAPNGRGGLAPAAHDDPVPKELMRNFAVAAADPEKHTDISDLARGLREIQGFSAASADWTPLTSSFAQWLAVRTGARGDVNPVISHDHYLLLVETMFDRVRQQYPAPVGVRFTGAPAGSAPPSMPVPPSTHRMNASFRVTLADRLGGTKTEVLRAIRAARANMKARVSAPFELAFDEETDAADLLAADDATLDAKAHRRKVKAFERRTLIAARAKHWAEGVELILWYGGTLFLGDEDVVEDACRVAISNWFSVASTNFVNPGGIFEAYHAELYPAHGMALSFPANTSRAAAFPTGEHLASLGPNELGAGFVPNLVSKYLYLASQPDRIHLRTNKDKVFDVRYWNYGMK